jgi:multiple sugar transport system substrate-binding protein
MRLEWARTVFSNAGLARRWHHFGLTLHRMRTGLVAALAASIAACGGPPAAPPVPILHWYVFDEPSGAFAQAAATCSASSGGRYRIEIVPLPVDADQQREQLARRLAAGDPDIDLIGMDVIWTAEFAAAEWLLPWTDEHAEAVTGRLVPSIRSARWNGRLWAAPFTTNAQMLWYRTDRMEAAPVTWDEMLRESARLGTRGTIEAQGARYEGLTVFFVTLLESAGTTVLDESGTAVVLEEAPALRALELMRRYATSGAAPPGLANMREDEARLGFESGNPSFMLNYTFVWPSARHRAPEVARHMHWARWPRVDPTRPSRVTLGGINLGIGAHTRHREAAFDAALCLSSEDNQRVAARMGGLPPTLERLYDDPAVRETFPFAETLRETLRDAVQRPNTPLYSEVSLAISHTLHPMRAIEPAATLEELRMALERALRSEGLL